MSEKLNMVLVSPFVQEQLSLINDLEHQKISIHKQVKCGILNHIDATSELEMINNKEFKIKKGLVEKAHVTKEGTPRTISFLESKQLWQTKLPDGKKLYGKTQEIIYEKLFEFYGLSVDKTTIESIFDKAINEKMLTENNNVNTIVHYRGDYKRFITNELGHMDIRKISNMDLKAYTQTLVNTKNLSKKAFLAYKSVLNLMFNYALEYGVITSNPVSAIKNSVFLKSCDTSKALSEEKILSEEEIAKVVESVRHRMLHKKYNGYFINGYAILLSIETGMRAGELCALKWDDIKTNYIHIHAQQLGKKGQDGKEYYYAPWTKDEKGVSNGGRKFPMTNALKAIFSELRSLQEKRGIESEFVLCHENGEWIKTDAYETCLRRLMSSIGMEVTNNHAFRMSLNSNVLIPKGIPVTERASLLGHSAETNLRNYSYARKDNLEDICDILNDVTPQSPANVVNFEQRKKPQTANLKAFN